MRKMMTVLACVSALVLGAYAEATSWFDGGIATDWPEAESMSGGEWASSSESVELSALATFAEGKLAVTATDADLQFAATDAKDASAGEVAVTSSMTFVPYDADDLPTPPEGAKGAICLAVTAGDTPVTNFYVLAKSGDANAWTLASGLTPVEAAEVTIGFKVAESAAKVQYTIGEQSTDWLDIVAAGTTVSRAGYSGIGMVASLSATYDQPAPATVEFEAPAVANASVKVFIVGDPDEEVEAVAGKYTVPAGANVKLVYTANSGYVLSGTSTFTFDGVTSADAITLGENAPTTEAAKAKIGDVFYISLNAAIDAATADDTVTLLDDVTLTAKAEIVKAITLDLNEKTVTFDGCDGFFFTAAGTVKNGTVTMNAPATANTFEAIDFMDADGLVKDVKVNAGNAKYGVVCCSDGNDFNEKTVACENVDVAGSGALFYAETAKMTLDADCSSVQTGANAAGAAYSDALAAGWLGQLIVNGGAYSAEGNVVGTMSSPATITLNAGTFTGKINVVPVAETYKDMGDHQIAKDEEVVLAAPEGYVWADAGEGMQSLIVPIYVAQIGEEKYLTLQAALDAAAAATDSAKTVVLLSDVTVADGVSLAMAAKNVILDLNGKVLTSDIAVTAPADSTLVFTVKNAKGNPTTGKIVGDITQTNGKLTISRSTTQDVVVEGSIVLNNVADASIQGSVVQADSTKAAITANGAKTLVKIANTAVVDAAGVAVDAKAGTVKVLSDSSTSSSLIKGTLAKGEDAAMTITGGAFASDPSAFLADDQMAVAQGTDPETWKIAKAVVQVGETKYGTELEALAAVQALEAAGTYPITVANLKGETITLDAMEQSVSLDAAETLTITADSWKFSGSFAGTVTLQPGKSIVAKGLKLGATIGVPSGYVLNTSEADADGFITYTSVKEEEPASGFHFYLASGTCPGVDFTNVTVVAGFDYETLGSLEKKDITATLTVGDKVYEGRIDWKGDENKALIDFGTVDTEAGANLGGTITLKTGDVDIDGATGTERIIAARAVTWVSEFAQEGQHGVTGTWSEGTVWDETGVTLSDTTFTPNTASGGNRVEILMDDVCFDGAIELPSETDGVKAAILIVDETEPKFAVLSNGTEWVTIDRSVYAPDATAKHCVRVIFDYVAKTVRYSVYDSDDNEIVLGEFDDKDAMGENVTKIDFSGSGKLASLQGDFWLNAVAQNPDGTYATSLADAAAGAKQIWDATYIPSKYATLALDLSEDWGLFFPEGWKYTTSVADGVTTYRFNDTDEAQILGETPTTYIFLDDAVAAATEGQTVQMLADVSGELVKQTNEVNITLDLAGKNLTGAMTEDEVPEVGTALVASGVITITNSVADAVGKVDGFLESEPKGSYQIYGGLFSEDFPDEFAPAGFYKKSEKIGEVDWYTVAKCLSIKGFFFSIADAGSYNGTDKEPAVTMKATEDGEAIAADAGYSVAYANNVNAGEATVTVTGTGMYMDETNLTFTIAKAPLTVTPDADQQKNVGENDPTLTYTLADGEQLFGEDAFSGALARAEGETAGTYEINLGTLTAGDNYELTFVDGVMFTIVATADLIGSDGAMIDGIPSVADPTIKQVKFTALDLATGTVGLKAGTITLAKETTASTGFVLVCKASLAATDTFTVPATLTLVADSTTDGIFTIGTEALETLRKDHPTQAFVVGIAAASAE